MIIPSIVNRRSVRVFTPEPISNEQLQDLIAAGFYAPTAKNKRDVHFTIITDSSLKAQLNLILSGPDGVQKYIEEAPIIIVPTCTQENREWAAENIAITTQHILLQATELSLGGVWRNVEPEQESPTKTLLHLPEFHRVINIIPLGHPRISMPIHTPAEIDSNRLHYNQW